MTIMVTNSMMYVYHTAPVEVCQLIDLLVILAKHKENSWGGERVIIRELVPYQCVECCIKVVFFKDLPTIC